MTWSHSSNDSSQCAWPWR